MSVENIRPYVFHEKQKIPCKKGLDPKGIFPAFDPSPCTFTDEGMDIEYNHTVKTRDGFNLRADIYLPHDRPGDARLPIVLVYTAFGKKTPFDISQLPATRDFDPGYNGVVFSKYIVFEGSDPVFWTKHGFAYVVVDSRGSFASDGDFGSFFTKSDGRDACDVIEYLGTRKWSNGCVGMLGASGLGAIQWWVFSAR